MARSALGSFMKTISYLRAVPMRCQVSKFAFDFFAIRRVCAENWASSIPCAAATGQSGGVLLDERGKSHPQHAHRIDPIIRQTASKPVARHSEMRLRDYG
jgi:hypothetical protein